MAEIVETAITIDHRGALGTDTQPRLREVGERIARLSHQVAGHLAAGRPMPSPAECRAFAATLAITREAAGLTREELAERAAISVEQLEAIEAGRPYASMESPEPCLVLRLRWGLGQK